MEISQEMDGDIPKDKNVHIEIQLRTRSSCRLSDRNRDFNPQ